MENITTISRPIELMMNKDRYQREPHKTGTGQVVTEKSTPYDISNSNKSRSGAKDNVTRDMEELCMTETKSEGKTSEVLTTHPIIHKYLLENCPEYRQVNCLRQKVF
jgi:hypothetical protein